ncbi:hypothetical protein AAF712_015962 [Marasmius tenuissimus]|uniref:ABM domain-containing protein n=1 Tax=Marasmius tenuissimus TaxID=585030 RepID=A0ABR2Z755_9AGAR|nr:hypothetical protein PM082_016941 [Marasmius tenuissimus]
MSYSRLDHFDPNAKFFIIADITIPPDSGKADEFEKYVLAIQKVANSDREPGTLMFRLTRGFRVDEGHRFTVLEEYTNKAALDHHRTSEEYKALMASDLPQFMDMHFTFREESL